MGREGRKEGREKGIRGRERALCVKARGKEGKEGGRKGRKGRVKDGK